MLRARANPLPEGQPEGRRGRPVAKGLTSRDRQILARLAELRLLSYAQVHAHLFAGATTEAAGQRLRHLARHGWLTLWKEPVVRGGRPAIALPTPRGHRVGLDAALAAVTDPRVERLVRAMLPSGRRRPLALTYGVRPPFLSHQREVNTLALDLRSAYGPTLLWASSWDRPFRPRAGELALPQPDLVCVLDDLRTPVLVFLEHDRGQESLAHFASAKVERYAELAVRPDLLERLTGFRTFTVAVTVVDARFHRPLARARHLADSCTRLGAGHLFRFALAGWVHARPAGAVWLAPERVARCASLSLPSSVAHGARTLDA